MKTLRNLIIPGALYLGGTGREVQVGDIVTLYLNRDIDSELPATIAGTILHPIVKIEQGTKTAYFVEYDQAALLGAMNYISAGYVLDVKATQGESGGNFDPAPLNARLTYVESVSANAAAISSTTSAALSTLQFDFNALTSRVVTLENGQPAQAAVVVTKTTPSNGQVIYSAASVDETHYITPVGDLPSLSWVLPSSGNSRVGQIKVFLSTKAITALSVSVSGGGSKVGTALISASINEAYSYQCVSVTGLGSWLRVA